MKFDWIHPAYYQVELLPRNRLHLPLTLVPGGQLLGCELSQEIAPITHMNGYGVTVNVKCTFTSPISTIGI